MTYVHGYQKPNGFDKQTPPEEDPEYELELEKFCDEAEAGGDEWMAMLDEQEITDAFRVMWRAWATKKTRATEAGVLFDFQTFDVMVQQFDTLMESAKAQFEATYEAPERDEDDYECEEDFQP